MKKSLVYGMISLLMFSLVGCDRSINTKEEQDEMKIYGFYELYKAPEASDEQSLNNIIKIAFSDVYDMCEKSSIAINVGEKGLFFDPDINSAIDYSELDYKLTESDISELLKILEKYHVMEWSELYGEEEYYEDGVEDGCSSFWELRIQFSDGTVKKSDGYYNGENEFPDNLRPFINELEEFVAAREAVTPVEG